ncbi:unnamed protein product (macronuclear) [Paramecium tetraurelia]|uniref:Uncharacterized protein n=1 Tax=Paramecium tetraurelia TaxID=5888 RepID=A0BI47_PARTE|nr:uncharacterized protein GSPATT00029250001 [Paramecium tetraurelia]CAK58214.1 unnamed protein product [Paramecium tetraurelia]|eukprot:XP_001425612.1 hypothetical protein (macronuclear) [Paramecium tetraurelia strain d4-2]
MSNQQTPESHGSSIIYTPIPLRLQFSASRSSKQGSNSNILWDSTSKQSFAQTHSQSPRKVLYVIITNTNRLQTFESLYYERPNNPMTRDEKFKELENLISSFDSDAFIQEVELFD